MEKTPADSTTREYLESILQSSKLAKELVRQILDFSRPGESEVMPILITPIVKEAIPCSYVRLTIRDTDTGMNHETVANIFEPFFTTKEKGKGTGLGLSTVYGIIKDYSGNISVRSEPDAGLAGKHRHLPGHDASPATAPRPGSIQGWDTPG